MTILSRFRKRRDYDAEINSETSSGQSDDDDDDASEAGSDASEESGADNIEILSLDDFSFREDFQHDKVYWYSDCVHCGNEKCIIITDWDLEHCGQSGDAEGELLIIVDCNKCGRLVHVHYYELDTENDEDNDHGYGDTAALRAAMARLAM